jgi:prepilin-type N-terminal cleavage/methylation domain-containing protein
MPGRQHAFTLIELLIVFSILGLLLALVAPLGARQMDKARAQEQWLVLERTVEGLAFRAFAEGREARLVARGTQLDWQLGDEPPRVLVLDRLFFEPEQVVRIDAHGIAQPAALELLHAGRPRSFPLNRWLEGG